MRLCEPQWVNLSPYERILFGVYGSDVIRDFGSLSMIETQKNTARITTTKVPTLVEVEALGGSVRCDRLSEPHGWVEILRLR